MKRTPSKSSDIEDDPLDREMDFSNAVPGMFFVAAHGPKYVRVIDKDLADRFPDNAAVNAALRFAAEAGDRFAAKPPATAKLKRSAKTAAAPKPSRKKERS